MYTYNYFVFAYENGYFNEYNKAIIYLLDRINEEDAIVQRCRFNNREGYLVRTDIDEIAKLVDYLIESDLVWELDKEELNEIKEL